MKRDNTSKSSWAGVVAGMALTVLLGWLLYDFILGAGLVNLSYDLLTRARPAIPVDEAVVVYLDEKSHDDLQQPYTAPWDRSLHARLIDRLTAAGARIIVFDIVFKDATTADADARLAEAIRRSQRVVLAADHVPDGAGSSKFDLPLDLFRQAARDRLGSAELRPGRDLIVRQHPPNDALVPSLSWMAAKLLRVKATQFQDAELQQRWLSYYAQAGSTPHISYSQALDPKRVPDEVFRNKAIFVGARLMTKFSGERKDEYRTPHSFWFAESEAERRFIAGVEIQAISFLNLVRGDWVTRLPPAHERLLILLLGALFGLALIQCRAWGATALAQVALLAVAFGAYGLFVRERIWFPWLILAVQIGVAWLWSIVFNSIRLYVENRLYVQSLELYLSPKLVKKFAADKSLLRPGARKQMLTILFTDIANFTSISEGVDSDELARLMNTYFQSAVSQCIHATDGTVVKYIGDAIFAFWNAPDLQTDHARRACEAALRFRDQPPVTIRDQPLITRLGLHTGEANVGNFGSTHRVDYTALGENINLASRMEGLNKHLGTHVLLTGETQALIGGHFITRPLGRFRLKGFGKTVEVFELLGEANTAPASQGLREAFAEALGRFQTGDLAAAEAAFRHVLEIAPEDGPTGFYLRLIGELGAQPLPEAWNGEVELKEK